MTISDYLDRINTRYKTGISREHSYRGDLQALLEHLCPGVLVTNEPARVECGSPDYVLTRRNIPVGYIEAKDIGDADLEGKKLNKEQFERYKASLPNLIFTDYLRFRFYVDGELVETVELATIDGNQIRPHAAAFDRFTALIKDFALRVSQTIRSASKLSKMMAGKARLLANVIENALVIDEKAGNLHELANNTLRDQMTAFKEILMHDITPKGFADIYAQTIAYGMFAARLHDETLQDFSRHEAATLIPKSNPFLRKLFQYISGYDIDGRIVWIVDALADIFRATDVKGILKDFGKATAQTDPMIHFYETFLAEYDPKLRKSRGVWYTPEPVVNFIVRAVDDILKTEFGLKDGLADTSKTKIKVNTQMTDKRSPTGYRQEEREVHKVQILDPATGTGTFLAEVIRHIYRSKFQSMQGVWSKYVEDHLIPRLNGFEILMASYAMAHLKLDMLLGETGYQPTRDQRLRIYLTNSLEEHHPDTGTLFANWLSSEANEANHVKRDTPVMVVIGNPPYAISSSNVSVGIDGKRTWIGNLIDSYKKGLNEKKLNLDDDYIKFIRYGQHFIEKNGEGILAYISNNSFIDGVTHRQMRKHLLETFDAIHVLNLHGNSNIKETSPDGNKDENVFDIRQGVSINILIKSKSGKPKNQIKYFDLYGLRKSKYEKLFSNSLNTIKWEKLKCNEPYYFFAPKDFELEGKYSRFFGTNEIYVQYGSGLITDRDLLFLDDNKEKLKERIKILLSGKFDEGFKNKYRVQDSSGYNLTERIKKNLFNPNCIRECRYRPFDTRYIYYQVGLTSRPGYDNFKHLIDHQNVALLVKRQFKGNSYSHVLITDGLNEVRYIENAFAHANVFPLYLYPDNENQQTIEDNQPRIPNLNNEIVNTIAETLGLTFTPEKETTKGTFSPVDLLDYIYAVLHSPTYREKYIEFLKIDFPRVPYPTDQGTFWQLVKLGGELRQIHLLESPKVEDFITSYPAGGDNRVTRSLTSRSPGFELTDKANQTGRVWINDDQYFDGVPLAAWEFYIGGYQTAQKWLKDRKDRELSYEDIRHYQKIIVALTETGRIMGEIDEVGVE